MKRETLQDLTELLQGTEFIIQGFNYVLNKPVLVGKYIINSIDFKYSETRQKNIATVIYSTPDSEFKYEIGLFKFLSNLGCNYISKSKALKELKKQYEKDTKGIDSWVKNYLNVDPTKLDTSKVDESEVEWLKKHTVKISAVLPNKSNYISIFNKAFPNAELVKIDSRDPRFDKDAQRSWVFNLLLDSTEDIPMTLQSMKTRDGMPALKGNKFTQTAYIWKLVRDNPEDFKFGKLK